MGTKAEHRVRQHDMARFSPSRAVSQMSGTWRALVEGSASPLTRWTLGPLLTTLACPYATAHWIRRQAYRRGWRPVRRLPCRVISVGNLTLGGTGKTPLVEMIVTLLRERGHRVGVLSRGYGRRGGPSPLVASDGVHPPLSPEVAGDEPVLLAHHLPGVPILVGKDRYAAGMLAVERFGVDVVVLDDGFQHLPLDRDLNIVLLDAARPLGTGRLFPRGELREPPAALARADVIVFTGWDPGLSRSPATLQLSQLPPPVFYSWQEPSDLCVLQDGRILPLASLNHRRVVAFCGIGTPMRFRRMLDGLGAVVVAFCAVSDHYPYTRADFQALIRLAEAHGAEAMLTTEKDGIRLQRLLPLEWPVWQLRIRARVVNEGSTWESCLLRLWEKSPG